MLSVKANATIQTNTMNMPPQVKGWCPGALRPMLSGDGLVVRIRPHAGRLTPAQAAGIAALSQDYGNGLIDLTSRANLQLRGVQPSAHPALIEALRPLGLVDASPAIESRRNIVVTPFWEANDGTLPLAQSLAAFLASPDAPTLPGKFGFALDCAKAPVLQETSADIRIECAPGGLLVRADGYSTGAVVPPREAASAAIELAHWYASVIATLGLPKRMAALAPHHRLPTRFHATAVFPAPMPAPPLGRTAQGWLIGAEFGQLQASTLAALSKQGALRLTPWHMFLIEGATCAPDLPMLITQSDDVRLRVVACTGAPGCLQAAAATRPMARALAPHVPPGRLVHVSGCTKGCAHSRAAATLVATPNGFDLIRHGKACDLPDLRALPAEAIAFHLSNTFHASPL